MNGRSLTVRRVPAAYLGVVLEAAPSRGTAYALLLAAAVLIAAALVGDAAGRVLALPAALLLAGLAARDLVLRPVLRADATGMEVLVGVQRVRAAWPEVEQVRVVTDRRTPLLEIDLGSTLVVLTRHRLGRPPAEVLDELLAVQAASR